MSLGTSGQEPSKIKPGCASEESFLGDALEERTRDRIRMKALSPWLYAFGLDIALLPARRAYAPASGS